MAPPNENPRGSLLEGSHNQNRFLAEPAERVTRNGNWQPDSNRECVADRGVVTKYAPHAKRRPIGSIATAARAEITVAAFGAPILASTNTVMMRAATAPSDDRGSLLGDGTGSHRDEHQSDHAHQRRPLVDA